MAPAIAPLRADEPVIPGLEAEGPGLSADAWVSPGAGALPSSPLLGAGSTLFGPDMAESTPADGGQGTRHRIEPKAAPPVLAPAPAPAARPNGNAPLDLASALRTLGVEPPPQAIAEASQSSPPPSVKAAAPVLVPSPPPTMAPAPAEPTGEPEGQAAAPAGPEKRASGGKPAGSSDPQAERASCSTCGGFHSSSDASIFHNSMGCADGQCVPGKAACTPPANECDTVLGAFISNLYQILNCDDPCYQPHWDPAAYASLFADYARPRTVTRIRYDNLIDMTFPDRNQYFLMQVNPHFPKHYTNKHGVTLRADPSANMQQLYFYQEAAAGRGSFFFEYPYRQLNPLFSPTQAGFSDINFGIKSLWLDTELLQVAFQFRTYTPSGNAAQGLGTGHFALDPSLMASMKLAPGTFFQAQLGNWIPLAGNQKITGGILYWYMSLNQVLCKLSPDCPLIGTLEMDGWSFENGGYTNPIVNQHPSIVAAGGGVSYFNIGPGLRAALGNSVDLGTAITFAATPNQWGSPWFRLEVRFLF
jgi:hypothetical protein